MAPTSKQEPERGTAGERSGTAVRDNSYVLGHHGFLYTGSKLASASTVRHPAVLLFSADYTPFRIGIRGAPEVEVQAVLIPPLVARSLDARHVPLLSFNVMPAHSAFHVFRAMQHPGAWVLDRHAFNHLDDEFVALHNGKADIRQAESAFTQTVNEALRHVPPAPAPDPKALELIRLLDANPKLSLEELARQCGRSERAMSRLFSSAVGMSMRDYQNWLKQRRVYDVLYTRRSLTQVAYTAGFADSPDFTRTYQRWYGQTPSASRDPKRVRVLIHGGSNEAPPGPKEAPQDDG
jgi:AraC family transcriptional regulator of arabinose operon